MTPGLVYVSSLTLFRVVEALHPRLSGSGFASTGVRGEVEDIT